MISPSLAKEKQLLLVQCDLDRKRLVGCVADLESRTTWVQLGAQLSLFLAPRLKVLLPVAGFLLPRLLSGVMTGKKGTVSAKSVFGKVGQGVLMVSGVGKKISLLLRAFQAWRQRKSS